MEHAKLLSRDPVQHQLLSAQKRKHDERSPGEGLFLRYSSRPRGSEGQSWRRAVPEQAIAGDVMASEWCPTGQTGVLVESH